MKFTHKWLLEYLDTTSDPHVIQDACNQLGLEVDDIQYQGNELNGQIFSFHFFDTQQK